MARRDTILVVAGMTVSSVAAAAAGYFYARRTLIAEYEMKLDDEVRESVKFILHQMRQENVVVSDEDPDILAEQMNEEANKPPAIVVEEVDEVEEPTVSEVLEELENDPLEVFKGEKVFGSEDTKPPLEELAARNQKTAYHKIATPDVDEQKDDLPEPPPENPDITVISRDIFIENGTEWEQETLTYFADGGVLDVQGDFVEDPEEKIGTFPPRFGELSEDENVVYIRNKKLEKEYEIISDPGNASDFVTPEDEAVPDHLMHSLVERYRPSWKQ